MDYLSIFFAVFAAILAAKFIAFWLSQQYGADNRFSAVVAELSVVNENLQSVLMSLEYIRDSGSETTMHLADIKNAIDEVRR